MARVSTAKIGVEGMLIHLNKGLYESEKRAGNRFRLSAWVEYNPVLLEEGEYLNYERLAGILKEEMERDIHLLETVLGNISESIFREWTAAEHVHVRIEKLHPAFASYQLDAVVAELKASR